MLHLLFKIAFDKKEKGSQQPFFHLLQLFQNLMLAVHLPKSEERFTVLSRWCRQIYTTMAPMLLC
jgi:hypothetical protein